MRQRLAAIHPFSPASYYWTLIMMIAISINVIWIPFLWLKYSITLVQKKSFDEFFYWQLPNYMLDILFIGDIFIGYFTGVCDDVTSQVYFDRKTRLRQTLIKEMFPTIASLPFSWFAALNLHEYSIFGYIWRFIHVPRLFACISLILERKPQMISYTYCCMIRAALVPLITIHWAGNFVLFVRMNYFGDCDNAKRHVVQTHSSWWECSYFGIFFRTFANSVTLLFGMWNGVDVETCQMIPVLLITIIGKIMFLYVFVQIVIVVRINCGAARKIMGNVKQLEEFMEYKDLPPVQRQRLLTYFSFCFSKLSFQESSVFSFISGSLKEDIQMHRCKQMVANVSLFQTLPMHVIVRIVVRLSMEIYMANEIVVLAGTLGSSMFFISTGTVVIYSSTGREICHLTDGAHFGEIALLSGDQTRIASVVAAEACELYVLRREAFLEAVAKFPELLEIVQETALERIDQTVALDRKSRRLTTLNRDYLRTSDASTDVSSGAPTPTDNTPRVLEKPQQQDFSDVKDAAADPGNEPKEAK